MARARVYSRPSELPSLSPPTLTTSISITETINGSHQFKINGYSLSKDLQIGEFIATDTFIVDEYEWALYFYPNGKRPNKDNGIFVSMFIVLMSGGDDVRALFELTLLDQSGKENHKVHSHFGNERSSIPCTLKWPGSMWGYKRYIRRETLEASDYLKDDSLSVHCTVGVVKSHIERGPEIYSIVVPPSNLGEQFGKLLESGKGTDVNFEVDGEIVFAHKLVLAARSPVFRAQLFGQLKDGKTECIKVEDVKAPVFKALLHFLYWDDLPEMKELTGLWDSAMMSQHLLAAADRYGLQRLRLLCEAKLASYDANLGSTHTDETDTDRKTWVFVP